MFIYLFLLGWFEGRDPETMFSHRSIRSPKSPPLLYIIFLVGLISIISNLLFFSHSSSFWVFKELICIIFCKKWQQYYLKKFYQCFLSIGFHLQRNLGRMEPIKEHSFSSYVFFIMFLKCLIDLDAFLDEFIWYFYYLLLFK